MAADVLLMKLGFDDSAATTIQPDEGTEYLLLGVVEIGSAPGISFTDGTTSQSVITSNQNLRTWLITNEWYLSCAATSADTVGWLCTLARVYNKPAST